MKAFWSRLGGQLGVAFCLAGFILLFLGWNGAASRNRVPAQFPYLISGGIAGLALVVIGVGLLIVQNQRADRAALQESIAEILRAMELAGVARSDGQVTRAEQLAVRAEAEGLVLAGRGSFHRPRCHLVQGRDEVVTLTVDDAVAQGLDPCRVCSPTTDDGRRKPARAGRTRKAARR